MTRPVKWMLIVSGSLVTAILVAAVTLPFFLPLDRVKDFAVDRISQAIHRQVTIEKVSFSLFSGVKLEKLLVSNRAGFTREPFVSADSIELRYAFWPLFKRQIVIKEIRLVRPEILVEKSARGDFNFSDITATRSPASAKKEEKPQEGGPGFSLTIDTFSIRKGKIVYLDHAAKSRSEVREADLTISGISSSLSRPIGLKFSAVAGYQGKDIPVGLAGSIAADLAQGVFKVPSLALTVAGERADISASVSSLSRGPDINFSVTSGKLTLDPLLAIFSGAPPAAKTKPIRGELTRTVNSAMASLPNSLRATGKVEIANLAFQKFKADKISLDLSLAKKQLSANLKEVLIYEGKLSGKAGVNLAASGLAYNISGLKLENFNSTPFVNALVETFLTSLSGYQDLVNKVYGRLNTQLSLRGQGVEPEDILANAQADGSFSLSGGEIKRVKILAEVGKVIKSSSLQEDIRVDALSSGFNLSRKVFTVKDFKLEGGDLKAGFNGGANLSSLSWVPGNRLSLKLSPATTKDLTGEFALFRDSAGWFELTFELTGSLKLPVPKPILEKVVEKAKTKAEEEVKKAVESKIDEEKKRLEEEAKTKLKELIRF